jgi:hypothetical protein
MRRLPVLAAVLGLVTGTVGPAAAAEDPLQDGRKAAAQLVFTATVTVRWVDAAGTHEQTMLVESDRGRVRIDYRPWTSGPTDLDLPPASRKYDLRTGLGPVVAGRLTTAVELWSGGVVHERLAVDQATGLVLFREQLGPAGLPVRVVTVEQLEVTSAPGEPRGGSTTSTTIEIALPRPYRTPPVLSGGYLQLAAFRHGSIVQTVYSDGLHGISVFAQRGRLDEDALPRGGRAVRVDGRRGWSYAWPGGVAVTWTAGGLVYTLVGDGPSEELVAAAASVRPPAVSLLDRLKRSSRAMAELLTGRRS